jgi:VCBS repeat-containing protein
MNMGKVYLNNRFRKAATNGTLTLATTTGLTGVSGDASKSVTFTGTRAEVNAALNGLVYDSDADFAGTDTINVSVNDDGNTGSGGAKTGTGALTVTVDPVNDTPAVTVPANQTAPEDSQLVFNSGNNTLIQIADVDAGTGLIDVTIALSGVTPGTVTLNQITGLNFQAGANGSASMTVRGTLANINAALSGAIYQGPTNANGFTTTMTVSVDDRGNTGTDPGLTGTGSNEIDSATFDITVPAVNDAPTVTAPGTQTAVEDDATGVTFGNIAFADVDADPATDTMTVTLSVANGTVTLSAAAITSIGAGNVTNNGTGTVTVTGTLNQLNAAINTANTITYVANANFAGSDPLTISVSDGGSTGVDPSTVGLPATGTPTTEVGAGTVAISVTAVNDAPTITVPGAQSVNEDTNLVLTGATAISIADIDSSSSDVTATLSVTSGTLTANGATGPLTSISGQGTNTLTLVGTAAEINTAIASLTYLGTANANGTDTLNINVNDGGNTGVDPSTVGQTATGGAGDEQANASVALTINAINDTPTVTVPGQQTAATAAGVTFSGATKISVADVDANEVDPNAVVRATVSVTTGNLALSGIGGLSFISGANNSGSMVIEGTLASINAALDGLVFTPGGDSDATATLSVTLNDKGNAGADPGLTGDGSSEQGTGTVAIQISEINDAPTITAPATINGSEDTAIAFTGGNQVQIGDVDAFSSDLRVTVSVSNGTLSLTPGTLAFTTGDGTSDATMVFEGTLTEINTALATLTYLGDAGYNANQGTETLNITVNDKGNTGVDPGNTGDASSEEATHAIGITVAAVNDAPTLTVPAAQTVDEDTSIGITGISFADTDVGENPTGEMRITLSAPNGTLNLATVAGLSFISGTNGSGSMVIEGTLAEVNAAVATLTYQGNANFNGNDTITVTVNDKGNTGTDPGNTADANSEEASATIGVTVSPVNDTPTIATPAGQTVNEDTNLVVSGVTFADLDSAGDDVTATLSVTNGILTINGPTAPLTTATGSGTGSVTLVGSVAEINAAIAGMTYRGNLNFHGSDTLALTINDGGNNGSDPGLTGGINNEVASANVGITVSPVNDAPTISTPVSVTTPEDTQITIDLTTNAADIDGGTGVGDATIATYTVQTLPSATQGVLFLADGSTQVIAGNPLTPTQAAGIVFKPTSNFNGGPFTFTYITTDSDGASSATATGAITVTPVNDTPTIATPATQAINEDTNLVVSGVTFADLDSATDDVTATLSVTSGILTINGPTGPLTTATGSGTGSVTLVGTVAEINAAIAGMTYRGNLNFHGSDTLALTINDGGNNGADPGLTGGAGDEVASANVAITVSPVNDAPTISTSVSVTTPEDTQITIDLTTNAADVDGGTGVGDAAIATYTVQTLPSASQGVLFLADGSTQVVAGNPLTPAQAAGIVFKPTPNFNGGPFTFTYITTDSDGASSATATGAITVTPVNDTPTITPPGAQTVNEDTNLTITGTSFADIDSGTTDVTATISVSDGVLTLAGTVGAGLAVSNDGSATVTLVGTVAEINAAITSITYRGDANFHGADMLTLTINDQGNTGADPGLTGGVNNEFADATVGITVNPVNDPPVATPFNTTTPENVNVLVTLAATDADGGTNTTTDAALDTITITALPPASEGVLTFADGTTPVVAGTPITPAQAADLRFVPALNFNGTVTVTFIGTDTAGADSTPATGTVIVSSTNTAPVLATNTGTTVNEGQPVTLSNTSLSVTDPDNTASQITYTINTPPANGQILLNGTPLAGGGTFTQDDIDNGRVTYKHDGSETTSDTFNVTASDTGGLTTGGTINVPITVNPVNDAPTIVVPGAQTTAEDTSLAITGITIADVDAAGSDMTVTVSAPNGTLTATATGGLTSVGGAGTGTLTLTGNATALNAALATLSYGPNLNYNGADTITVLISDGGNTGADPSSIGVAGTGTTTDEQASSTIAVTITAVNDIPVANTTPGTPDVTIEPGGTFTGFIPDYFTDPDGGPYVFAVGTSPANGTLVITDPATGQFEYTPNPGFEGTDTFGFTVDGAAIPFPTPVLVQVTILVQNTNVAFIDPSVGQPADIPDGRPDGGLGDDVPGVNFDPRQIQFGDGDLNLQNNNEYIRAVVEDRIDALERQYGAASGGEVLGDALGTPLENRNNNANIGEVTLSGPSAGAGGFFGSSALITGLSNLATEAGGTQPPAEEGEADENAEDQTPEDQEDEEEENEQDTPAETTGDGEQTDETTPPAPGDQTGLDVPAETPQFASTAGMRFSEQIAAESQRMEQQRISLLGAVNGLTIPEATDLPPV